MNQILMDRPEQAWEVEYVNSLGTWERNKLFDRIARHTIINPETGCHESTYRNITRGGYRKMGVGSHSDGTRRKAFVHRVAAALAGVPMPKKYQVNHICQNTKCCNIEHLEVITSKDHVAKTEAHIAKVRRNKTHCLQGHPYDSVNTYWYTYPKTGTTGRYCRACAAERNRRYRANKNGNQ